MGTKVFTTLAEDYARYRPGYPTELRDVLTQKCGLTHDWRIADIGSGTGNLARVFLADGYQVIGIEPNCEMREAGERLLAPYAGFRSLDGTAECMPLDALSVDLITVGQALHWFDIDRATEEFRRILRPDGWVAVVWNDRIPDATAFTQEYDAFTSTCCKMQSRLCNASSLSNGLDGLFEETAPQTASFSHIQSFDLNGLLGRSRSSGFVPQQGMPNHEELTAKLTDIFIRHQQSDAVEFHYITRLYFGRL